MLKRNLLNLTERILTPKASRVFTVSPRSKHVTCLGITLERKLALQARTISWVWRRRKVSPLWRQSKIQMTRPVFRVSYDDAIIHIFRSYEIQPTAVPLSGTNICGCSTHGAVSALQSLPTHFPRPFLCKVVLHLFQPSPPQVRLFTKAARMVCSGQAEFPHVCLFLFPLEAFWMKTHLWWCSCPKAGCSHVLHFSYPQWKNTKDC